MKDINPLPPVTGTIGHLCQKAYVLHRIWAKGWWFFVWSSPEEVFVARQRSRDSLYQLVWSRRLRGESREERLQTEEMAMDLIERLAATAGKKCRKGGKGVKKPAEERFALLYDFCSIEEYKGQERTKGTLNCFWDAGTWKMFLNDRHTGLFCCVSSETLQGVLEAAEGALGDPETDWRAAKPFAGRKGRKP